MLNGLDFMAFETPRTMPYPHSPYPEPIDEDARLIKEAKEKIKALEAFIKEHQTKEK